MLTWYTIFLKAQVIPCVLQKVLLKSNIDTEDENYQLMMTSQHIKIMY